MYDPNLLEKHIQFTKPEYRMFVPTYIAYESDEVHLYVTHHAQYGGMLAFWTQSSREHAGDNHLVMARSKDNGVTWSAPQWIIGAPKTEERTALQASWGFPVVTRSGRIYLFYFRETGGYSFLGM